MNAGGNLRVLIIDDSQDDALLLAELLKAGGLPVAECCVETLEQLQEEVKQQEWDIVLCDNNMPRMDAASAFEMVCARHPGTPFIIVSGDISEEAASGIMKLGASDYISKHNLSRLVPAVERELRHSWAGRESGIPDDRRKLMDVLARHQDETVALVLVELCRYRDLLRQAGGAGLVDVFQTRLEILVRHGNVFRLRDDTFALVIMDRVDGIQGYVREIVESFKSPLLIGGEEWFVTCRAGVCVSSGTSGDEFLQQAETALQCASDASALDAICLYHSGLGRLFEEKLTLEKELFHAVLNDEFELVYQPQFDLQGGRIIGAEALLRWRKHGELVSPAKFIPVLEETGLIVRVGEWVMRKACEVNRSLQLQGVANIRMAVNLSAIQFRQSGLPQKVAKILQETGLDPAYLALEITENIAMHNGPEVHAALHELRAMGVQLALDDFGVGYSSLSYLTHFPVDKLKIDQSFVKDIVHNKRNEAIVTAIVVIAENFNLGVIAEGVETEAQANILRACGCHEVQGYYFCRPISEGDFRMRLSGHDEQDPLENTSLGDGGQVWMSGIHSSGQG